MEPFEQSPNQGLTHHDTISYDPKLRCKIDKSPKLSGVIYATATEAGSELKMDETFNWFTKADLSRYEDMYVSIVDKEVVCADEDPEIAYNSAKQKYPDKEVVLWKVPQGEAFIFNTWSGK